jgi:hypothetical protein
MDYVHTRGFNEPRARSINFFEDLATHLPRDPRVFGRPYPQYIDITLYETTAKSEYDGSLTYLQPANSTEVFYQPRQVQLGFRVTY